MMRPYRWLAEYYDQVFSSQVACFASARQRILGKILPRVDAACDIACGTGTTAIALARAGIRVYAADLSPAMCRLTRRKAKAAGAAVRVIHSDMREWRLPEPVSLVLCEADALNHVPRKTDLALVAGAAGRALRPGGYFYFDVNNRLSFERMWPLTWYVEKPGLVVVMRGASDPAADRAWSEVEWFIREGNCWRRRHERVEEVCWSPAEIRAALTDAGFDRVRAWDATLFFEDDPLIRRGYRTFYLARKSKLA